MLATGVNAPVTTSAGRLFDGVAALLGLHQQVSFEGQAAMALEFAADRREHGAYPIGLAAGLRRLPDDGADRDDRSSVSLPPAFSTGSRCSRPCWPTCGAASPTGIMAARFHNALVEAIVAVAQAVGEQRVALTGGCFQNRLLTERAAERLERAGFEVLAAPPGAAERWRHQPGAGGGGGGTAERDVSRMQ